MFGWLTEDKLNLTEKIAKVNFDQTAAYESLLQSRRNIDNRIDFILLC